MKTIKWYTCINVLKIKEVSIIKIKARCIDLAVMHSLPCWLKSGWCWVWLILSSMQYGFEFFFLSLHNFFEICSLLRGCSALQCPLFILIYNPLYTQTYQQKVYTGQKISPHNFIKFFSYCKVFNSDNFIRLMYKRWLS